MSIPAATRGNDSPQLRDDATRFLCGAAPLSSRGPLGLYKPTNVLSESSSCRAPYEERGSLSNAGFAIALHPADDESAQVTNTTKVSAGEERS